MQNIVILAGNIGQKPEVRSTQSGTKITNFTLATSRPRLSEGRVMHDEKGYRVMDTEWHRITCFNGLGKWTFRNESGNRTFIITTSRMISGLVRKYRKGLRLVIQKSKATGPADSRPIPLTAPSDKAPPPQ